MIVYTRRRNYTIRMVFLLETPFWYSPIEKRRNRQSGHSLHRDYIPPLNRLRGDSVESQALVVVSLVYLGPTNDDCLFSSAPVPKIYNARDLTFRE